MNGMKKKVTMVPQAGAGFRATLIMLGVFSGYAVWSCVKELHWAPRIESDCRKAEVELERLRTIRKSKEIKLQQLLNDSK